MEPVSVWRREFGHALAAVGYFSRLPVPSRWLATDAGLAQAARYLPLVGVLLGGLMAAVAVVAGLVWPQSVALLLALAAGVWLTGALHEDGLADTADGLGGGWDKARILEIMKDSRLGSFGATALCFALGGRFVLLLAMPAMWLPWLLLAGAALSRACALLPMVVLDYARPDGDSKARPLAQRLSWPVWLLAALPAVGIAALLPLAAALAGVLGALLVSFWLIAKYRRWLGGYAGDCLGAVQQCAELAFYLGALALLGA